MFSRLLSCFRAKPVPAGEVLPAPAPPPPSRLEPLPDAEFEAIWSVLSGASGDAPPPFPAELKPLADEIRAHFLRNKPAPSSFPTLAIRIMDLLAQPDVDLSKLIQAISPDPAVSTHLMRVANSALYHRGQDVLDLRTAIMRIGVRGVGEIAAGVAGRSLFDVAVRVEYETFPDRWQELFRSTMTTAFAASQFSFEQHHGRPDRIFLGGMFMDIGMTLALRALARLIIAGQVPPDLPAPHVDALLEEIHSEIGTEALRIWGLPSHLVELCQRHHEAVVETSDSQDELHALRVVDGVGRLMRNAEDLTGLAQTRQSMEAIHMDRVRTRMLHKAILEQQARVAIMFPG